MKGMRHSCLSLVTAVSAVLFQGGLMAAPRRSNPPATAADQNPATAGPQVSRQGSIGVALEPASADGQGIKIKDVVKNGPADQAGLRAGDIVTAMNGTQVQNTVEMVRIVISTSPGASITIAYLRGGEARTTTVVVLDRDQVFKYTPDANRIQGPQGTGAPSVKRGDPPPGTALTLSIPQARAMLKEAIAKRYVGTIKDCARVLMIKGCESIVTSPAADVRVRSDGFDLAAPYTYHITAGGPASPADGKVSVKFKKDQEYIQVFEPHFYPGTKSKVSWQPNPLYKTGYLPDPEAASMGTAICAWTDERAAQEFADAFNRLLYAAYHNEEEADFAAAAKAWRETAAKPPLNPEANRERVLAENAIKEKNLDSAADHYQAGLEIQPLWPEAWFNLGYIYGEQKKYADAADCMKHYLVLVPDAPDAKDVGDQVIIWEDKAKQ